VYIPEKTIEEIRERADIVDVASRYVELRRSGSNFKALCPFHQEKTPSFMVSPEKQIFHCFGCGKGGNVFALVMELEGISFPEAVRMLGKACGIEVAMKQVPEEVRTKNDACYRANEFCARWYHKVLMSGKSGENARSYLSSRGISQESWKTFSLGCTTMGWDSLFKATRKAGIPLDILKELKLIVPGERTGGYYDYFRKRLIFPIFSVSNRVLAFGARTYAGEEEPKYLNSAESPIFAKRRTLFGINHARDAVRSEKRVLLVEGYTDCISLNQMGFKNAVASCGTAISWEHASLLRRLTQNVVLLPDGDEAGEKAAVSAGSLLAAAGLKVRVGVLDPGDDPDSTARKKGISGLASIIEKAMDYFEYLNYIIKCRAQSLGDKEETIKRVLDGLVHAEDPLHKEMMLQELAGVFKLDASSLRERAQKTRRYVDSAAGERAGSKGELLEKITLRLLLENPSIAGEIITKLDADDFIQKSCRQLYKLLDSALEKNIDLKSHEFQKLAEEAGLAGSAAEVAFISVPPGDISRLLRDYVRRIKEFKIRDELKVLSEKLRALPEESEEAIAVAEYYNRLKIALSEL
jgi:DNA primase